ncbi:MAG: low molecular weight protein-tyrosine phosphatase, partial [Frankiaceae bacterium]|nr:low molecular weight protein-tyrosine phosphatase [Frankiaceae bacterium]
AGDRIFALTEFARLVCAVDVAGLPADLEGRARAVVALAAAARAADAGAGTSSDADLADPFGAPVRVFARTAAQIRALLEPLVSTLGGVPAQATPGSSLIARAGMVQP